MRLSKRQKQIAELIADDIHPVEIAARLGIAFRTVQNHLLAARKKKNAKDTLSLAAFVRSKRKTVRPAQTAP